MAHSRSVSLVTGARRRIGAGMDALASGDFQFATGSVINLDGGLLLPGL